MDVTVGVMAHNEEKTMGRLLESLLNQRLKKVRIREIVVVSSGSTDRTDEIVRGFCRRDARVRLVTEPERRGKSRAINLFLGLAKTDMVVLECGDTVPEPDAIERLCLPLYDEGVGITMARPVSFYKRNSLLGYSVYLIWEMYHHLCTRSPKYGELMAFRRVFDSIEDTSVDEETIGARIRELEMESVYVPDAVFHAGGPESVGGFLSQRRRIFAGHLFLKRRLGHKAPSMGAFMTLRILKRVGDKRMLLIAPAMGLECFARLLGFYDYLRGREDVVWKISR